MGADQFYRPVTELLRAARHRSEQYRTSSQSFAHFFRHLNGSPHVAQVFSGRLAFLTILGMG
jgi:hypothetical protein